MKYGYSRVSTVKQGNGNSLEAQRELLLSAGADEIFEEKFTGTKIDRPELDKLLKVLQPGDMIIVTKLDRIARSISKGTELIEKLIGMGITVNILNLGVLDNSASSRLVRNIFLSFAEFERDMIVERTTEGRELARQKEGYRDGRPKKFRREQREHAVQLLNSFSYSKVSEMTGISVSTLVRAKREALASEYSADV